jgi:putative flippase GtrA
MAARSLIGPRGRAARRSPEFIKLVKYASVSAVTTVLSLGLLYLFYRVVKVGSAAEANIIATAITTIPSYYFNRTWAWGKSGKSHMWREVVPFWVIAFISLVLSTAMVALAAHEAHHIAHTKEIQTILVECANLATYAVLWVGKFILFNKILFKPHSEDIDSDSESGEAVSPLTATA